MFFFNYNNPLYSAILLYIIAIGIIMIWRPNILQTNNRRAKSLLPLLLIVIGAVSYYMCVCVWLFNK